LATIVQRAKNERNLPVRHGGAAAPPYRRCLASASNWLAFMAVIRAPVIRTGSAFWRILRHVLNALFYCQHASLLASVSAHRIGIFSLVRIYAPEKSFCQRLL
jgi:hypothetical protein